MNMQQLYVGFLHDQFCIIQPFLRVSCYREPLKEGKKKEKIQLVIVKEKFKENYLRGMKLRKVL